MAFSNHLTFEDLVPADVETPGHPGEGDFWLASDMVRAMGQQLTKGSLAEIDLSQMSWQVNLGFPPEARQFIVVPPIETDETDRQVTDYLLGRIAGFTSSMDMRTVVSPLSRAQVGQVRTFFKAKTEPDNDALSMLGADRHWEIAQKDFSNAYSRLRSALKKYYGTAKYIGGIISFGDEALFGVSKTALRKIWELDTDLPLSYRADTLINLARGAALLATLFDIQATPHGKNPTHGRVRDIHWNNNVRVGNMLIRSNINPLDVRPIRIHKRTIIRER